MQPAKQLAPRPPPALGAVYAKLRAETRKPAGQPAREFPAAEAVDEHPHGDAAARRRSQGVDDRVADGVVGQDVGLQGDGMAGLRDGLKQRREVVFGAGQQIDAVAWRELRTQQRLQGVGDALGNGPSRAHHNSTSAIRGT